MWLQERGNDGTKNTRAQFYCFSWVVVYHPAVCCRPRFSPIFQGSVLSLNVATWVPESHASLTFGLLLSFKIRYTLSCSWFRQQMLIVLHCVLKDLRWGKQQRSILWKKNPKYPHLWVLVSLKLSISLKENFFSHFNQGKVMAANIFRAEIGKCDDRH